MRLFYIFKINPYIEVMLKDNPYELYHALQTIYYRDEDDINIGYKFISQLIEPLVVKDLDIAIFKKYKNNYFYMKYKNVHSMHDVYRKENTVLSIYKTYIKLETNKIKPQFLESLKKVPHLFVCDFQTKDYFWLDSLTKEAVFL